MQLTLSNGVVRLLAIVTMPILTSLLSPQAYGVATLLGTVISLVSVFALAGIDVSYARTYHSMQVPNGIDVELFCWRFAIFSSMLMAAISALAWATITSRSAALDYRLALLLASGIILSVVHTMTQTRARLGGRYQAMALVTIASGIIGPAAGIAIAAWWRQDALALILPMLLSYLIPTLLLGVPPVTALVKPSVLSKDASVPLIKIGLAAIVTAPMYWLLSSSDRWFLQYFHGAEAVGIYSIGYSVGIIGMMVNTAVMAVWLPEASREYEQDRERAKLTLGRLMSRLVAAMALIWLMATAAGGDIVRLLANERFHASADFVPFIAGGVFFYGTSQLALYGLVLVKQFKWAAVWWLVGGLVCALLNFILVQRLGGLGAAITQSASFAFIAIGILATSQAKYRVRLDWGRLGAVIGLVFFAGLFLAPTWHTSPSASLLMKFPLGVAVAAITSWLIAPDWCDRGARKLFQRRLL
ncbi:MAG: lipopolysaccharide biosynthesis protein [Rhodocyclales bacterium]|nr:lipopolysaccharide biosynthesis protein [Rhodocyclales bacterium]